MINNRTDAWKTDVNLLNSQLHTLLYAIDHFEKYHNTLCFSPQILHKHCFQFLLGLTMVLWENKNNAYARFGGTSKEYYRIFGSGLLTFSKCRDKYILTLQSKWKDCSFKFKKTFRICYLTVNEPYILKLPSIWYQILRFILKMYLFHWPCTQQKRKVAGHQLVQALYGKLPTVFHV